MLGITAVKLAVIGKKDAAVLRDILSDGHPNESAVTAILGGGDGEYTTGTADEGGVDALALVHVFMLPAERHFGAYLAIARYLDFGSGANAECGGERVAVAGLNTQIGNAVAAFGKGIRMTT